MAEVANISLLEIRVDNTDAPRYQCLEIPMPQGWKKELLSTKNLATTVARGRLGFVLGYLGRREDLSLGNSHLVLSLDTDLF